MELACDYCYNNLSITRDKKSLECGHTICCECIDFLKRTRQVTQCPFHKINYSKPIQSLPAHEASLVYLPNSQEACTAHSILKTHYSKHNYKRLCLQCIEAQHISEDDIIEKDKFNEYLSEKLYTLRKEAKSLSDELERNLEVASLYGAIAEHADSVKNISKDINSDIYQIEIDKKLKIYAKCKVFSEFPGIDMKSIENLDPYNLEKFVIRNLSDLGISREKKIVSSNSNEFAWSGTMLSTFVSIGGSGYYLYSYRIESSVPVRLTELGLGSEFYESDPVRYNRVLLQTNGRILDIANYYSPSSGTARITKKYIITFNF